MILAWIVVIVLQILAFVLYSSIYFYYVPERVHSAPVYFDFGANINPVEPTSTVAGIIDFSESPITSLKKSVFYSVELELELPRDTYNADLGNFMVSLSMPRRNDPHLDSLLAPHVNKRPAILPFRSPTLELANTAAFLPLYLTTIWRQSSTVVVPLAKDVPYSGLSLEKGFGISIDRRVNIAQATLNIHTQYEGLRGWMYHYRIILFVVGPAFICGIECIAAIAITWLVVNAYSNDDDAVASISATPLGRLSAIREHKERFNQLEPPAGREDTDNYPSPAASPMAYNNESDNGNLDENDG